MVDYTFDILSEIIIFFKSFSIPLNFGAYSYNISLWDFIIFQLIISISIYFIYLFFD